ncbi:MAG TPA: DUF885 domain-containing protein, partial [Micromonosporaceae bacterium]|nr:DUF885 domain-containing protein [Micromonosporaceae bacterium]
MLAADPALANSAGDHRYDDQLPDLSPEGISARVTMLRDAAGALSGVDTDGLDAAERVDHEQLLSLVDRSIFALTEIREHEWNPLVHNPGALVHALVSRPFAPAEQRLESLAGRLAAIPDALATARSVLTDCPQIHLETAAAQFRGTAAFIRDEVPRLGAEAPTLWPTVKPQAAAAVAALESFAGWLQDRARDASNEGRNPRLGRRLWEAKLWHTLDTELTAADVLRLARENLDRVGEEIRAAAAELIGGKPDDDTVMAALNRLADEHPDNESIVSLAEQTLGETTRFVSENGLVSLVSDPCVIQEMPEFARGVAVAYCDAPGPLEDAPVPTFYCIAPTPADWTADRVESFYREYNDHMVRNLTVHEAMPGHYLQLAHSRRYVGSTRARAVARSGPFIEGWAVYAEEMMVQHGFGGLPVRLQQLKMQLRMTINAILDQLVHCEDLTEGEA